MSTTYAPVSEITCVQTTAEATKPPNPITHSTPGVVIRPASSFLTPTIFSWINTPYYHVPLAHKKKEQADTLRLDAVENTDRTQQLTQEPAPEHATQVAPEPVAEFTTQLTPEPAAEFTTQLTPEPAAEFTTQLAPEAVAEFTTQLAPEAVAEFTTQLAPEPVVEYATQLAPEPVVEYATQLAPEAVAEFTTQLAPEPVAEFAPQLAPEPVAEFAPQLAPEAVAEFAPQLAPEPVAEETMPAVLDAPLSTPLIAAVAECTAEIIPLDGFDINKLAPQMLEVASESQISHVQTVISFFQKGGEGAKTFGKIFLNDLALQRTVLSGLMNEPGNPLSHIEFLHKELALRLAACSQARQVAQLLLADI